MQTRIVSHENNTAEVIPPGSSMLIGADTLALVAVTSARGTITLLSRLSKSVHRQAPESLLGMSLRHYLALSYVADPGGISQQQLSEILCIDANNTVLLLNEMEGQRATLHQLPAKALGTS